MAYTKKKAAPANHKKYIVRLAPEERQKLSELRNSKASKERRNRAEILLKADVGEQGDEGWTDELIAECLDCSVKTAERTRQRFVTEGLEALLAPKKQSAPSRLRKLDGRAEAHVIAVSCGKPPEGRCRWTSRLLADKIVELEIVESISHKTVWETLKKTNYSLT
jgi:transposase